MIGNMTDHHDKTPSPFCLRLSQEERAQLEKEAAGMPLGEHIRRCVFDENRTKRQTRGKEPVKDHKSLAQILGLLGKTRYASNLNQIAKAANSGNLVLTHEIKTTLNNACTDLREIRDLLIKALGLKSGN